MCLVSLSYNNVMGSILYEEYMIRVKQDTPSILTVFFSAAMNPFEAQQNVDVKFVEEVALKQTFILLGLENK